MRAKGKKTKHAQIDNVFRNKHFGMCLLDILYDYVSVMRFREERFRAVMPCSRIL